ncbi:putative peroxisomal half ABC transporter [Exidia glandulosa HHB12029]|uniref:Putative peroxisomal half ABC transporter n=1 Tax=Exidia glandulosa HHB12029 TaxID=1314781 RepID=A0A165MQ44_EXIGL|nr:putative peroxisomal half ABC transporter [Exidia glandulosa HHB12029]
MPLSKRQQQLVLLATAAALLRSQFTFKRRRRQEATPVELDKAQQQLYVNNPDGSKDILVPFRRAISHVNIVPITEDQFAQDARHFPVLESGKTAVDKNFMRQLVAVMRIAFPSWTSKQVGIVLLHSVFLVLRTYLSVVVAKLDGRIVRDLVNADGRGFLVGLGLWFALAIPSTYTNTMIRHLQSKLSLNLRTRMTRYTHDLYLSAAPNLRYYRLPHEGGLDAPDQYITADIAAWCEALSTLYGNVMKPSLDMFIFTAQLARGLGFGGSMMMMANYVLTASILRAVTPAFGRLAAIEARLEGEYRAGVGRVGRESEEIAFYDGGSREKDILTRAYMRLIKHVNSIYKIRIAYEWTEDYVIKYLWSAIGYILISVPILFPGTREVGVQIPSRLEKPTNAVGERTENYISSRRLLISLADAGGRLMYAYKDLLELAGLTTRLYSLLSTLHALRPRPAFEVSADDALRLHKLDVRVPVPGSALGAIALNGDDRDEEPPLVRELDLDLPPGEHLMITGPNGVGKTAIARILAGLWAADKGSITRPPEGKVFFVPQRAYMVVGTLRDQIIYPHTYTQFLESGRKDEELTAILHKVHLAYLPEREGGLGAIKEWRDVLSGGEKQRMNMARVFYHMPKFAVLDEATSAVSSDVEGLMYQRAKDAGISLITISHRPSLTKYHTRLLTIDGDGTGRWEMTRVGTAEERMGLDREIVSLEAKLADVEAWEARVRELEQLLKV